MRPHLLSRIDSVCGHVIFVEAIFPPYREYRRKISPGLEE